MVYYTYKTYKNWNCFRKLILQWIELNELNVKIKFSLEIRIFCKCSWALRHHHAALKLKRIPVLSYFTPHDPTIRNSTMHDSNIIIQISLNYAEKTINTMQLELYFT